jgi:3-deoxy-7-phosphoheptulonate synthase
MVVVLKPGVSEEKIRHLVKWLEEKGLQVHETPGEFKCVLGLIGDTAQIDEDMLQSLDTVESVARVSDPFKACNRNFHPEDTVIDICAKTSAVLGGGHFALIAGPCSVETEEQITFIAEEVKRAGAAFLRGGAFKPRTSPYDFQGLGEEGLRLLSRAKRATGLPIVTELMDIRSLDLFGDVDVIQVGARNTQNYDMLKELGRSGKAILLKRGLAGTIKELLMSAEYIMASGNDRVILCERGIRSYESTYTRNTLDLSAVPVLKSLTHLPVVVDPSHATGKSALVRSMSLAAVAAGADGIMIEVHNDPKNALCDGPQSLTPPQFAETARQIFRIRDAIVDTVTA